MAGSPSFSSLADLVKHFESGGGDYQAQNPKSSASGAYQFTDPTWLQYAPAAGVDTRQYPTARSAPPAAQDAVFAQTVSSNGLNDWTCAGCNPQLTSYLADNPQAYSLPISSGAAGSTASGSSGGVPDGTPMMKVTPDATGSGGGSSASSPSLGFYVVAIVLVVVLLSVGMFGLVRGA